MRRSMARSRLIATALVVIAGLAITTAAATGAEKPAAAAPTWDQLSQLAQRQGFTAHELLGNDRTDLNGSQTSGLVRQRIRNAWSAAKKLYYGDPVDRSRVAALNAVVARHVAADRRVRSEDRTGPPTQRELDDIELRLLSVRRSWPGERDVDARRRIAAVLTVDGVRYGGGRYERALDAALKADGNAPASSTAQALCGALTLGPAFQGLLSDVFARDDRLSRKVDELRGRCQQKTDKAVEDAKALPGKAVKAVWDGALGDAVTELQKGVAWLTKQVGKGMDATLKVSFGERWLTKMLSRSAAVAVVIGMFAYLAGLGMAILRADFASGAGVIGRAMLTGVIGGSLLALLQLAVAVTSELTALLLGGSSASAGRQMELLAQTTSTALQDAKAPAVIALLMMILLLVALLVVWLELLIREPLLYLLAFWYAPAYAASAWAPARRVVSTMNGLLVAVVLMPMLVVGSLALAAEAMAGADDVQGVLTSIVLLLMAAASPMIVMMVLEPGGTFAAGAAAAIGGGAMKGMAGRAASAAGAGRSAAAFAGERMAGASRQRGQTTGGGGPSTGPSEGSGGGTGGGSSGAPDDPAPSPQPDTGRRPVPTSRPAGEGPHGGQPRRDEPNGSERADRAPDGPSSGPRGPAAGDAPRPGGTSGRGRPAAGPSARRAGREDDNDTNAETPDGARPAGGGSAGGPPPTGGGPARPSRGQAPRPRTPRPPDTTDSPSPPRNWWDSRDPDSDHDTR